MKPVSKTAFYCCGLRMEDARSAAPVCNDTYAERFMNEVGLEFFARFEDEVRPNASNLVRHRLIDDILRVELAANRELQIFTIGAGFDTRPYRLSGGRWTELDAPELIDYKNERLPVSEAGNALARIPVDFDAQDLGEVLGGLATRERVVVVVEGVLLYLDVESIRHLLVTTRRLFPDHRLVCDLMTRAMFERYAASMQERLAGADTGLAVTEPDPADLFVAAGYRHLQRISIPEEMGRISMPGRVPKVLLKTVLRTLHRGYTVNVFDTSGAGGESG